MQDRTLLAAIRDAVHDALADLTDDDAHTLLGRYDSYAADLYTLTHALYGSRDDYAEWLNKIVLTAVSAYKRRPPTLRALDRAREADPRWYQTQRMVGGVLYADLYAETLEGIAGRIPYFKELGLTYLHVMPPYRTPPGSNDGGYAVSSYRETDPRIGSIDDLRDLAEQLRQNGINLVLDFVFNHTADDHAWAQQARQGDPFFHDFYFLFPDRSQPDAYEKTLREIFPDQRPGNFTYLADTTEWVWTTFNSFQWDLNYRNPAVFQHMLGEMLFLANLGADVLRLDAVPFIWKEMGTSCENRPEAHTIIRAYNVLVRMAAPAMIFKSEAIVHPDDVHSYFGSGEWTGRECELSYNPLLMVSGWEALATGYTSLLTYAMRHRFDIPANCAWINYVRSHDDIGWGFADEDAEALNIHGFYHRQYLNRFYTGEEEGSFARGLPFQFNPRTLDMRISGTTASLAGLEAALNSGSSFDVDHAVSRITLLYGIAISASGIPLIYLGDEVGTLNDRSFVNDPLKEKDSRWVHRPPFDAARLERRHTPGTVEQRIFSTIQRMIAIRREHGAFGAAADTTFLDTGNPHVIAFDQAGGDERILVLGNFAREEQTLESEAVIAAAAGESLRDLLNDETVSRDAIPLGPYQIRWLTAE